MAIGPDAVSKPSIEELTRQLARALAERDEVRAQQAATSSVLKEISRSTFDLTKVLQSLLDSAMHLGKATTGGMLLPDSDGGYRMAVLAGEGPQGNRADLALEKTLRDRPIRPGHDTTTGIALLERRTVHTPDINAMPGYRPDIVAVGSYRTNLAVPMMRDGDVVGVIVLTRGGAVSPFTDRQIELVETFAAQAVIAIGNVRLFNETREALARQTATAEILMVIASSPADVQPVFDAIAESARLLCGAQVGSATRFDGEWLHMLSYKGASPQAEAEMRAAFPVRPGHGSVNARAIVTAAPAQVPDIQLDPNYQLSGPVARAGLRSMLGVPMVQNGRVIGVIGLGREVPGPYSDNSIALVQTFADQAVIAVENVRLFTELTESLEQQTATADILRVISRSPTDVQPVLEAVTRAALRFCGAPDAIVLLREGDENVVAAHEGTLTATLGLRRPIAVANFSGQAMLEGRTRQIADVDALDAAVHSGVLALARQHKWRASAAAPMMHSGKAIGCVVLRKPEPGLLSPRQIALLETFAAQAVIAIENVRLFTELKESLEQQTATAEILRIISRSLTDVRPVLDAVVETAARFCGAEDVTIALRDGDHWVGAAHVGPIRAATGERILLSRETIMGRAIIDGCTMHVPDIEMLDPVEFAAGRALSARLGLRAMFVAPMLREGVVIGGINLRRATPGPFTKRQIELAESLAAQAVIAIENVRLFTEQREALEQQTATAEILRVISQSPTDVQPVLSAVAKAALRFCGAADALISLRDGDDVVAIAHEGALSAVVPLRRKLSRGSASGRCILDGRPVEIVDMDGADAAEFPESVELARSGGWRAALAAPMLRDGVALGSIFLRRPEPGPFTPRQLQLLEAFAAQAVIAIENVRLFTELRDSLERLKAAQANLVQSEKMASLGQLTAGIAHEIKNPLNFVNNFAGLSVELLAEIKEMAAPAFAQLDEDKRAEIDETMALITGNLEKIAEHGKRADGIVKSMLSHSRGGTGEWQAVDINALVEEALNLAYHGARAQDKNFNITLERDLAPASKPIEVVPQDVTRVFLNLFSNGFYAANKRRLAGTEGGFKPMLRVSTRDLGEMVEIKVRDNGTGIPDEVRAKLFQPFFTTKPTGEGTGLGLSISYDIVTQQHGGMVEVDSEVGSFTEFTVRLPRSRRAVLSKGA